MLMATRLDRPARSTRDLLNILVQITDQGAGFRSIADALILSRRLPRRRDSTTMARFVRSSSRSRISERAR
jgi:DNA invertase Pin-like site-specific DNA recombinase